MLCIGPQVGTPYDTSASCSAASCDDDGGLRNGCARTCNFQPSLPAIPRARDVFCPAPPASVSDGVLVSGSSTYPAGTTVQYRCSINNSLRERVCLTSGEWAPMETACTVCDDGWLLVGRLVGGFQGYYAMHVCMQITGRVKSSKFIFSMSR